MAQSDGQWLTEVSSGSGLAVVYTHEVTLSSAQILNLHDTAIPVTPTPLATQMVVPVSACITHLFETTVYDGFGQLELSTYPGLALDTSVFDFSVLLGQGSTDNNYVSFGSSTGLAITRELLLGQPLVIANTGGAFTDGDGTLEVQTLYTLQT